MGGIQGGEPIFRGPNILSRGTRPIGRSGDRPINLRGFVSIGAGYWGGLTRSATDDTGSFPNDNTYSGFLGFGGYGSRADVRSNTAASYRGGFQLFSKRAGYTGINQAGSVQHSRQIARRWSFFSQLGAASYSTVLSGVSPQPFDQPFFDPAQTQANEVFDSRSYSVQAGAGVTYQKSARLTFGMSGGAFTVRRKSAALIGNESYFASGEMAYQLSRRTSVGAIYGFGTSFYRKGYGEAFFNTYQGAFSRVLSPRWQFSGTAGMYKIEMDQLRRVAVDPLVTLLTGQTSVLEAAYENHYGLAASAALSGRFQRSNFSLNYYRGANPGNGFVLASQAESANAYYTNQGFSRIGSGVWASWTRFKPVLRNNNTQAYETYGAGTGASLRLTEFLHFTISAGIYRSDMDFSGNSDLKRTRYLVSAGLTFSPGEVPLVLW
jgi:hypothetical protein